MKKRLKVKERQEKVDVVRERIGEGGESEGKELWRGWILTVIAP